MLSEKEAERIVEQVIGKAKADHVTVSIEEEESALTRFANNVITQNVDQRRPDDPHRSGVRAAARGGNGECARSHGARRCAVACGSDRPPFAGRPRIHATAAPPAAPFPAIAAFDAATAGADPELRASGARTAIQACERDGATGAGFVSNRATSRAIGNNAGLFAHHLETQGMFSLTAEREGASGWVRRVERGVGELGIDAATQVAIAKAKGSAGAADWPAGRYPVILEPAAVAGMLSPMTWGGMWAKDTHEGRTFLSGKVGKKLASERVMLVSDPFHPRLNGQPWFADGLPNRKVTWIDHGAFVNLSYDRFTAKKHGQDPTPWPNNLVMEGGSDTLPGLIAGTEKGILVTHFWYIRFVDRMSMLLTGMTRDGLFAIENGKVTGGIKNFRWNMSVVDMLANIQGMTAAEPASDVETDPMILPALKVADWNFTSPTTF